MIHPTDDVLLRFKTLLETRGTPSSVTAMEWFRGEVQKMLGGTTLDPRRDIFPQQTVLLKSPRSVLYPPGKLYMFAYEPVGRQTLPYWDKFPLIFALDIDQDYILGINLHYLPPRLRIILFYRLLSLKTVADTSTRLKLSYKLLSETPKYSYGIPCIKKYKKSNIKTKMMEIPEHYWETVVALPTEMFQKSTNKKVWDDTRKKLPK